MQLIARMLCRKMRTRVLFGMLVSVCVLYLMRTMTSTVSTTADDAIKTKAEVVRQRHLLNNLTNKQLLNGRILVDINDYTKCKGNTCTADVMKKHIRVLCWIMTHPGNLYKKAIYVQQTWGNQCTILLMMSSKPDDRGQLPVVALDVQEGRAHLTAKTMAAFEYVFAHYYDQIDWVLKADDDTYVFMENLRYLVADKNPNDPLYYGMPFKAVLKEGYNSGGSGYLLSREALWRFGARPTNSSKFCHKDYGDEDVEMGRCLHHLGVSVGDTRDKYGRGRFFCYFPEWHLIGRYPSGYPDYPKYGVHKGLGSISRYAISFHYISPDMMLLIDMFSRHIVRYGRENPRLDINGPPVGNLTLEGDFKKGEKFQKVMVPGS